MERKKNKKGLKDVASIELRKKTDALEIIGCEMFDTNIDIERNQNPVLVKVNNLEFVINFNGRNLVQNFSLEEILKVYNEKLDVDVNKSLEEKAMLNSQRLKDILLNFNEVSSMVNLYVIEKELASEVVNWLTLLPSRFELFDLSQDAKMFRTMFKTEDKDLVVDGNSYCAVVNSIYNLQKNNGLSYLNNKEKDALKEIAYAYAHKKTLCKYYKKELLSDIQYHKDIQMLQIIAMAYLRNQKSSTWKKGAINIFEDMLIRIMFAVSYINIKEKQDIDFYYVISEFLALKYLIIDKNTKSKNTTFANSRVAINYTVFRGLFSNISGIHEDITKEAYKSFFYKNQFIDVVSLASNIIEKNGSDINYALNVFATMHKYCYKLNCKSKEIYNQYFSTNAKGDAAKQRWSDIRDLWKKDLSKNKKFKELNIKVAKLLQNKHKIEEIDTFFDSYVEGICEALKEEYLFPTTESRKIKACLIKMQKSQLNPMTDKQFSKFCSLMSELGEEYLLNYVTDSVNLIKDSKEQEKVVA